MFAGIVEGVGEVVSVVENFDGLQLGIKSALFSASSDSPVRIGDSICVSGVCLTIAKQEEDVAVFDVASETRRVTTLDAIHVGTWLNLERSLRVGERIHGHFVTGHVDAVARVIAREGEGGNTVRIEIFLPSYLSKFVTAKGAITVNGTSLTVGTASQNSFSIFIIPHTLTETTFGTLQPGDRVNLEIDVLARYVVRALEESLYYGQ